ncbi:MAG: ABC transporter permease, partial [Clostridia bacterium]|nr:ABC transporter permease [Clostridia bacterium]
MKKFNRIFTIIVFTFLYVPMIVLMVGSFNEGRSLARFTGFTFGNYGELFRDGTLISLLVNSLIIAVISALAATVLGTMAALGVHAMSSRQRKAVMMITNIPMTNPEIV